MALAMRHGLIVVGEVRGAEAFEFTRAVNAGTGFLCTVHANSAVDALAARVNAALEATLATMGRSDAWTAMCRHLAVLLDEHPYDALWREYGLALLALRAAASPEPAPGRLGGGL